MINNNYAINVILLAIMQEEEEPMFMLSHYSPQTFSKTLPNVVIFFPHDIKDSNKLHNTNTF